MSLLADLRIRVGADLTDFQGKMALVKTEIGGLGSLDKVASAGMIGAAAVIAGVGVVSLKMATDFQSSTAQIAVNAQIPQKAADDIGKAFLTTAGQSTFSGKAMADAFGPVAGKLGELKGSALSTAESLNIMKVSSDLAEATGQDLGATTKALSDVMIAYHMPLSAAAGATDDLFNASRIANVGVDQIALAVDKMHSRLGDATPSLATTSGLLVDLSDHGLVGGRGLMQVTSAMMQLEKGGKPVDDLLHTMGASLTDATGATLPLTAVIAQLQPKLLAMPLAMRESAMQTLFHVGASSALGKVVMEGSAALQGHIDTVGKVGSAHAGAIAATDNLAGRIRTLKATFDDAMVTIGLKMVPAINDLAKKDMPLLISATGFLADHLNIVVPLLGGVVGLFIAWKVALAAHAVVTGIWSIATGAATVATTLWNTATGAGIVASGLHTAATGLSTVTTGAATVATGLWTAAQWLLNVALDANPIGLVVLAIAGLIGFIILVATHFDTVRNVVGSVWNTMSGFAGFIGGAFAGAWNGVVNGAKDAWNGLLNFAGSIFDKIKNAILSPFQNLHIPLPHFNIGSQHIGIGPAAVDIPTVDIKWYAKGGIFDKPTMLANGAGVGDAGPEAAAPISELAKYLPKPQDNKDLLAAIDEQTRELVGALSKDGREHPAGNLDKNALLRALGSLMADYNYANSRGLMRPA